MKNNMFHITGKVRVFAAGEKNLRRTEGKDIYAPFFAGSIGVVPDHTVFTDPVDAEVARNLGVTAGATEVPSIDPKAAEELGLESGEFYSFDFNINDESVADYLGNLPCDSVVSLLVRAKTKKDSAGAVVLDRHENRIKVSRVEGCTLREKGWKLGEKHFHTVEVERKEGTPDKEESTSAEDAANA